ncbi:S28 family serine protease [Streptomyces sp. HNM0663]|uniref:S28 family serine protease n=1 Tax=Streptomyces chengmaiensis TaxID=3040919 RepID=A0ABT6HSI6_9ACTN|nr:S28 family serine protease [Streptomyces chengmaiensis]MDH2391673.1 S28 family serine protease [Streptomyces chengmaiensis]
MRNALRWLLSLVVLIGAMGVAGGPATAHAATAAEPYAAEPQPADPYAGEPASADPYGGRDIKDRILAIPGMSLIEEKPYPGYRFFVLDYTQPVDHRWPYRGTFQQRITVLHKDTARPTVFYTSGYHVSTTPRRAEPTAIVDGNQVSLEYRFFSPSRPSPADWSKLDIRQAAGDQHRVFKALKKIYRKNWIATGGSKGGMTATYYERFYPRDMDGVVAYVAPNDVVNREDSAYDRFLARVGTRECRDRLGAVQRQALVRREALEAKYRRFAEEEGYTFTTVGSLSRAYEAVVLDFAWAFWQYSHLSDCEALPTAATASDQEIYDALDAVAGLAFYTDQGLAPYTPYYYQAGTELGSPDIAQPHLDGLVRYGYQPPRSFVPREIPMRFKPWAMYDVDRWVRHRAQRMMFVYGENDPWGAEPFRLGRGSRDSYVYTAPGANHGAGVADLKKEERARATASILEWAGVAPRAVRENPAGAKRLTGFDAGLDKQEARRMPAFLP